MKTRTMKSESLFYSIHKSILTKLIFLLAIAVSTFALAEDEKKIVLIMTMHEEVSTTDEDGNSSTQYIEAKSVIPGDILRYTISYHNKRDENAEAVIITNPIPPEMTYIENSATGDNTVIQFSVDGGTSYDKAENLKVSDSEGGTRPATHEDYTNIQWQLNKSLAPGSKGSVSYRAKLQ